LNVRRRILVFAAVGVLAAGCSGDASETTTTTTAATTTTTSTTTTGATTTTTTSAPPSTTGAVEPLATTPGTPPAELDAYSATLEMSVDLGELAMDISTEGVWTSEAFSCTASTDMFGLGVEEHVVATSSQVWVDSGFGFQPSSLDDPNVASVIQSCPASPGFWERFALPAGLDSATSERDEVNGIPARRIDLQEAVEGFSGLGLVPGLEGITLDTFTAWISDDGYLVALDMSATVDEATLTDIGLPPELDVNGSAGMTMRFELADLNDPDLIVEIPE
jgi:hypothetical protein